MKITGQSHFNTYHAHVYFDASSQLKATRLCEQANRELSIPVGRFHKKLVGPHPCWSCQLTFNIERFDDIVTWLELNRDGLTILIHAVTGDNLADHTRHIIWLGNPETLNLEVFTVDIQFRAPS